MLSIKARRMTKPRHNKGNHLRVPESQEETTAVGEREKKRSLDEIHVRKVSAITPPILFGYYGEEEWKQETRWPRASSEST